MAKPDIFDEIIACLQNEAETVRYASVSHEVLDDLFSDILRPAPSKPMYHPQPRRQPDVRTAPKPASAKAPSEGSGEAHPDYSSFGMDSLRAEVAKCVRCRLHAGRTNPVFGDGDEKAGLMFIGEGPGADEDLQGLPFVGKAGELLTRMISAMQFRRPDVFIANIVKCRPPNNRAPEEDEAETCLPFLLRQIELVSPKVIVLLGATPLRAILKKTGITKQRGHWHEFNGVKVMPTFHPAYLLRNPPAKKEVWEDLQQVMKVFGKTPASPKKGAAS